MENRCEYCEYDKISNRICLICSRHYHGDSFRDKFKVADRIKIKTEGTNGFKSCAKLMFDNPMTPIVAKENRFKFRYNDSLDRIEFYGDENQTEWIEDNDLTTTTYWFRDNYKWKLEKEK